MTEVHVANGQFSFPALAKVPASRLTWISLAVLEYDSSEFTSKKPAHTCSISYRPSSIKPSMRSSRSRITLVGYDEDLEYKLDTAYGTTDKVKESTWLDHFLGVFCIRRRGRVSLRMTVMPTKPEEDEVCGSIVGGVEYSLTQVTVPLPLSVYLTCPRSFDSKGQVKTFHTERSQMYDRHRKPSRELGIQNICH